MISSYQIRADFLSKHMTVLSGVSNVYVRETENITEVSKTMSPAVCSRAIFTKYVFMRRKSFCNVGSDSRASVTVFWMSVRLTVGLFDRNGTALLRFRRTNDIGLLVRTRAAPRSVHTQALNPVVRDRGSPGTGWQNRWNLARRAFVDNLLNRVTNSLSADLRRRTARQLMYGNSRPFFALVGMSLASGNGMLTNDNQLEGVCWEIRVST